MHVSVHHVILEVSQVMEQARVHRLQTVHSKTYSFQQALRQKLQKVYLYGL